MARWLTYLHERFPLGVYLVLSLGFAVSGGLIGVDDPDSISFDMILSALGILIFFGELRLMDELKDYAKDVLAHPERPLPRGLLSLSEVKTVIRAVFGLMILFGIMIGIFNTPWAGGLYLGFTLYLGLMFKEFYLGEVLAQRPLLYAITHQIVLVPICLYTVSMGSAEMIWTRRSLAYAFTVLGAFFAYEVSRKLDPRSHPLLKTYLSLYGVHKTTLLIGILLGIAGAGARGMRAQFFLWPIELLFLVSLSLLFWKPSAFKRIEGIASLSLIFHIWSVPIQLYLSRNFT